MSYGETEAVRGIDLEVRRGRDLRLPRPQRRRQDVDGRDPRGLPQTDRGRGVGARRGSGARGERLARPHRHRPAVEQPRPVPDRARVARTVRRVLQPPALGRGGHRPRRPRGKSRRAGAQALRRPAAPPRRRHGAGRRPRAALPRRADHRLRPLRPAPVLGRDRGPARPRQDGLPHHPLHGRGAAPRRPGDDHRRRPDRRRRDPRGPRRTRQGDDHDPLPRRGGRGGLDRDPRPGARAEPAHRRRDGARRGPRGPGSDAALARGRLPRPHRDDREGGRRQ